MGAPYSQDLRDRVLAACDRGMKTKQVATVLGVCCSWESLRDSANSR